MSVFGRSYGRSITGEVLLHGKRGRRQHGRQGDRRRHRLRHRGPQDLRPGADRPHQAQHHAGQPRGVSQRGVIDDGRELAVANDYRQRLQHPLLRASTRRWSTCRAATSRRWCSRKWLFAEPEVLILDEPTRGIDVGAKYEIYTLIDRARRRRARRSSMISSEMPELLGMCDRIYVMNEGRFVAEFAGRRGDAGKDHARHREIGGTRTTMTAQPACRSHGRRARIVRFLKSNLRDYGMLLSLVAIMVFFQFTTDGTLLQAAEPDQPGAAEQLHRHHGAGHAAGDRRRPHRPVGRLGGRLHRRAGGGADGAVRAGTSCRRRCSAWPPARRSARRRAIRRLLQASRPSSSRWPACWSSRAWPGAAAGPVGRAVSAVVPAAELGLHSRLSSTARRCASTSLLIGVAVALRAGRRQAARARATRRATAWRTSRTPFFVAQERGVRRRSSSAFSYLLASYKGLPNVLIVMALLMLLYDFVTTRTTIGRRIYALGGNEKAAQLSGIKTERLTVLHLRQHGRAGRRWPAWSSRRA